MQSLSILYTHNIGGDLALLPHLYTYIEQLQKEEIARTGQRALLVDIGGSCHSGIWHCEVTGGRSTLVVLDGMGYHAVNIVDILQPSEKHKLKNIITTAMIDERTSWRYHVPPHQDDGIVISALPTPALRLCIVLSPTDETALEHNMLTLQAIDKAEVGRVVVDLETNTLSHHDVLTLPKELPASMTITAAIEFMEDEARYFAKQQNNKRPPIDN